VRVGLTGLARAGKTALLTSLAANLLARRDFLPGHDIAAREAPAGAEGVARFDIQGHAAALRAEPPAWPRRTEAVSLLALDLDIARPPLPARKIRLEVLDYPGEWLLDLPLLGVAFAAWSERMLRRLEGRGAAARFLSFVHGLPAGAGADEELAREGTALYREALRSLRTEGAILLQPGKFLMLPPGPPPPWMAFFPHPGRSPLAGLLEKRFAAYVASLRRELAGPGFGRIDRLVVLADVLGALAAGQAAFDEAAEALGAVATALRWRKGPAWLGGLWPGIARAAFVASKADHVAAGQRGNLAALVRHMAPVPGRSAAFAVAAVRCTEDFVWTLEGRPVSAVRGHVAGRGLVGSYPGEVPAERPDPAFWRHRFLQVPEFQPLRATRSGGLPQIGLDVLLAYLLEDVL
jgi:predicted YcjX-like family ATPase